ncbi:GAF domain-containing SpoIIE family protein phosphatase [Leptospira saintgironsiae]|uniref:Serine/threonine protein phosphatase n=1 Tax=Leptospira saintgironsiae TaxID=2023183 RepID=A0A2M9YHW8_9LEPT|nr:GAF domain-containing SpoIIE family protein phosphatase [Leptospira saintgironsiae]PJZ51152.1 serine/threonine protein phosphatase [Leptospira saintgironsiae]
MSCVFCGEFYLPDGKLKDGKFLCNTCGREWILEKRKRNRIKPPEVHALSNEILLEFLSLFNTSPNLDDLLQNFTNLAFRKLNLPGISVMVYEPRLDRILVKSCKNKKGPALEKLAFRMEIKKGEQNGPLGQAIETCKSVYYRFDEQPHKQIRQYGRVNKVESELSVPIHLKKEVLGLINVDYEKDDPVQAEKDRYFLELIASQFATTLKNRILFEVSQTQSRNFRNLHSAALKLSSLGFKYRTEIFRVILLSLTEFSESNLYVLLERKIDESGKTISTEGHILTGSPRAPEIKLNVPLKGEWNVLKKPTESAILMDSIDLKEWKTLGSNGKKKHLAILPVLRSDNSEIWILLAKEEELHWSPEEIDVLNAFAVQAGISVQNFHLFHQRAEKERLDKEIEIARDLQRSLLPRKMPDHPNYEFGGIMVPAIGVGGDYYDFITHPTNKETYICIGDVSGKGVPAGIVMATVRTVIHSLVRKNPSTWEILQTVNTYLYQNYFKDIVSPRFMSLTIIHWDQNENRFVFSGGGQGNILVYRKKENRLEEIPTGGVVLGIDPDIDNFENSGEFQLEPGDFFLMFTDGVWEAMDPSEDFFEMERLHKCVFDARKESLPLLLETVLKRIKNFTGEREQTDDITLIGAKRLK